MKKNRMLRVAAVLLVAVMLTTSVISGTFAKYVTSTEVKDQARVAYWGFEEPNNTAFDLFDGNYTNVKSQDGANVVAPGTEKETSFAFAYTENGEITAPEVAYTFEVDATIEGQYDLLDQNTNFWWTLDGVKYGTVADLLAAIEKLDGDKTYAAGELPVGFGVGSAHTIGWEWDFGTGDVDEDAFDTQMGNADVLDNVIITIKVTATQVD